MKQFFIRKPNSYIVSNLPEEDWDTIDDFLESLGREDKGKLNRLLLRSLNPADVASTSFLEILIWPIVSPTSSSDMVARGAEIIKSLPKSEIRSMLHSVEIYLFSYI